MSLHVLLRPSLLGRAVRPVQARPVVSECQRAWCSGKRLWQFLNRTEADAPCVERMTDLFLEELPQRLPRRMARGP